MAAMDYPRNPIRDSLYWDETECHNYYGMLSLHEIFDIVASHLTESDIDVLSFLLDESFSAPHPLDPAGWTVEPYEGEPDDSGMSPSPALLKTWKQLKPQGSQLPFVLSNKPKSGLELLLELERRGYLSDGNLEPLLQLLRVLTRHDLLPLVSRKKRRAGINPKYFLDFEIVLTVVVTVSLFSGLVDKVSHTFDKCNQIITELCFHAFQYLRRELDVGMK